MDLQLLPARVPWRLLLPVRRRLWLPDPANHIAAYLSIWIWTAALSAAVIGDADVRAHAADSFRHGGRDDPHGRGAIPAVGWARAR